MDEIWENCIVTTLRYSHFISFYLIIPAYVYVPLLGTGLRPEYKNLGCSSYESHVQIGNYNAMQSAEF